MDRLDCSDASLVTPDADTQRWLQSLPTTVYVTDAAWWLGDIRFVSDSVEALSGRSACDYLHNPQLWLTQIVESDRRGVVERLQAALDSEATRLALTYAIICADGQSRRLSDTLQIQRDAAGQAVLLVGQLTPETIDTPQHSSSLEVLVAHTPDLLLGLDQDLDCHDAAGAVKALLGIDAGALVGHSLYAIMAPEDAPKIQRALDEHAGNATPALLELRLRHASGHYRWFEIHFSLLPPASTVEALWAWVAVARDITERRRQALRWDAYTATDELTSALNHDAFMGLLRQAVIMADSDLRLTLIVFQVDHYADIQSRWGREGADLMLACIGEMCRATLRERFSFGRLEENVFALLLSGKVLQEAAATAERLKDRLTATRVEFHGQWLSFSVSLGVAERQQGESAQALLTRVTLGLRDAEERGGDRVQQAPEPV